MLSRQSVGESLIGASGDVEFARKVQTDCKFSKTVFEGSSPSTPVIEKPLGI